MPNLKNKIRSNKHVDKVRKKYNHPKTITILVGKYGRITNRKPNLVVNIAAFNDRPKNKFISRLVHMNRYTSDLEHEDAMLVAFSNFIDELKEKLIDETYNDAGLYNYSLILKSDNEKLLNALCGYYSYSKTPTLMARMRINQFATFTVQIIPKKENPMKKYADAESMNETIQKQIDRQYEDSRPILIQRTRNKSHWMYIENKIRLLPVDNYTQNDQK